MSPAGDAPGDTGAAVGPRTAAYLRAFGSLLAAMRNLVQLRRQLHELGGRQPLAPAVAGDPADLRDEFSQLQAGLQALAPLAHAADERVREALRAARAAWARGEEAEPVQEERWLAAEYARLADALRGGG
jgi:hypothetical protein